MAFLRPDLYKVEGALSRDLDLIALCSLSLSQASFLLPLAYYYCVDKGSVFLSFLWPPRRIAEEEEEENRRKEQAEKWRVGGGLCREPVLLLLC